jgi:NAD(P)-dependent dehydrogenase (short-subunit alcohol dehydrogenase family)
MRKTVLITGANRGIGLELTRQYATKDAGAWTVIATARSLATADELQALFSQHGNITLEALDVADHASIDALAAKLKGTSIDVLINNAGVGGGSRAQQTFGQLDYATLEATYHTNAVGPLKMTEAFLEHVAASQDKKVIVITSGTASLTNAKAGPYFTALYAYRMSKTAVNMAMRLLAADLAPRGISVGIFGPGMVETRILWDGGYKGMGISPEQSVTGVIANIDALTVESTGKYVLHNGSELPW